MTMKLPKVDDVRYLASICGALNQIEGRYIVAIDDDKRACPSRSRSV